MGAEQPALQERDRPVAALYRVVLAPLGLGLDHCLVRSLAQAVVVVAGVPVGHDAGVVCDLTVGEALDGALIIVLDVSEAHPSVRLGGHQNGIHITLNCAVIKGIGMPWYVRHWLPVGRLRTLNLVKSYYSNAKNMARASIQQMRPLRRD